jgi:predicted transcriptional regulator
MRVLPQQRTGVGVQLRRQPTWAGRDLPRGRPAAASLQPEAFTAARKLVPLRRLSLEEASRLAERQANSMLQALGAASPPVPTELIAALPKIRVRRFNDLPVSGFARWESARWLVGVNASEPTTRQRFSLAHEIKHILDSPFDTTIYAGLGERDRERVADHFAACLLMPRPWVEEAAGRYSADIRGLARRFRVSPLAMRVRLHVLARSRRRTRPTG